MGSHLLNLYMDCSCGRPLRPASPYTYKLFVWLQFPWPCCPGSLCEACLKACLGASLILTIFLLWKKHVVTPCHARTCFLYQSQHSIFSPTGSDKRQVHGHLLREFPDGTCGQRIRDLQYSIRNFIQRRDNSITHAQTNR